MKILMFQCLLLMLALFLACGAVEHSPNSPCVTARLDSELPVAKVVIPELLESDPPIEIIILGDKYGIPTPGMFDLCYDAAVAEAPDVMISIGDILDDGGLLNYSPMLYTTGNHDDDEMIALGLPLYSDTMIGNIHIILIDNGSSATIDSAQMAWIDSVVQIPADWTVVCAHRMFWNAGMIDNVIYHELHDLFVAHGVDVVFAGHHHRLFIPNHTYDGVQYINVGRTAGFDTRGIPSFEYNDTTYVLPDVEPYGYIRISIRRSMQIAFEVIA